MERNTKTTIYDLQIGDRFYKCNDKKKDVYERLSIIPKRETVYLCLWAGFADKVNLSDAAKAAAAMAIKGDTEVIFLRHKDAD